MIWWVIALEGIAFAALFTATALTSCRGDRKYTPAGIHNYPPDIREEYFKTHARVDVSYRSKHVLLTKSLGVLIFAGILFVDENHTEYTDRVEIQAGWKTVFVWLWAKAFHARRQRKWIGLLRKGRVP